MDRPQSAYPEVAVALAWQPRRSRDILASLFDFDRRLATVVGRAREPLLAQMRLAWWRDRLGEIGDHTPPGEPLLTQLVAVWGAHVGELSVLVDGWESLLGEAPLSGSAIGAFADGRGGALGAFAERVGASDDVAGATAAGRCWAFADLSWRSSHEAERAAARSLGQGEPVASIRSRELRGVAVLGGLSRRALERAEPLMHGRRAALAAIRLGMFGR